MNLILRADAGPRMGSGHVMRCLALAQAWQDGERRARGRSHFVIASASPAIERRLGAEDLGIHRLETEAGSAHDADRTASLAAALGARWVVVDGYHFGSDYQRRLADAGIRVLLIDDQGRAGHCWADLVLNQNLSAREEQYRDREPGTSLLLGTRYALLQRPFLAYRNWRRAPPGRPARVLVTLGGADAENVSSMVLRGLRELATAQLAITVIAGAANPHVETLRRQVAELPGPATLRTDVSDMPDRMAGADVAVAAGGITSWELAFMGLPSLAIVLAENQWANVESLAREGVAVDLGWHEDLSPAAVAAALSALLDSPRRLREMSRRGRELVDGDGTRRVIEALEAPGLKLRDAGPDDCRLVWEWFNDPVVRAASFSSDPIAWEEHVAWFDARLGDPADVFYIATDAAGLPLGQVRFKIEDGGEAVAAVSVAASSRGKGLGCRMIALASARVIARDDVSEIHAFIKPENAASVRAFEKAGYRRRGETTVKEQPALIYVRRNEVDVH